ncbi:MAG TPA: hypothetical protein VIM31_03595 [Candidatus Microsaccharimonas sp.]|jgi:flagellar basal body-associated protein FliL
MKISNKRKKKNSKLFVVILIVVLLLGALSGVLFATGKFPLLQKAKISTQSTGVDKNSSDPTVGQQSTKTDTPTTDSTQSTTDKVPVSNSVTAKITELTQRNNQVLFTATISGTATNGTCVITFSNPNDKPVVKTVASTVKDGVVMCGELQIPTLEFSYIGTWSVDLRFYIDNQQATASDKIDIR